MPLGVIGKYEKVDVLGHGASGIVYLAWDTLLKKQVALKEVDVHAADVDRFLEEARVLDRLRHPNIVSVHGVDQVGGRVLLDMEYVKGLTLQQKLREQGALPTAQALDIVSQLLAALRYAHANRTLHRDIKPANILIDSSGTVKLVDFGLAEIHGTNSYAGGAGTYAYMAPEDFDEDRRSDHRSDLWAAGVILYELLTGQRPFHVERTRDPFAWRKALRETVPPPIATSELRGAVSSEIVEALNAIAQRALARDKADRYASAEAFLEELERVREQMDGPNGTTDFATERSTEAMIHLGKSPFPAEAPKEAGWNEPEEETLARPMAVVRQPIREAVPGKIRLSASAIDFGELRKGEERGIVLKVKLQGGQKTVSGRVARAPEWLDIFPSEFKTRRVWLRLRAFSGRVWQTGEFQEDLQLETSSGEASVPIRLRVLPPRPSFASVAWWYVPSLAVTVLPAIVVAWGALQPGAASLAPAAALSSAMLSGCLAMAVRTAGLGIAEQVAAAINMLVMVTLFGATYILPNASIRQDAIDPLIGATSPLAALLLAQSLKPKKWKLWLALNALLSILVAGVFLRWLAGG